MSIVRRTVAGQPPAAEVVVGASEPLAVDAFEPAAGLVVPAWPFAWLLPRLAAVGAEPLVAVEAFLLVVVAREGLLVAVVVVAVEGEVVPPPVRIKIVKAKI